MNSKTGEMVTSPYSETTHATAVGEVLYFDYLHVGTDGPLGEVDLAIDTVGYLLVLVDDPIGFTWLEPTKTCNVLLNSNL
ncbi:unnamed protein product [Choristocarpus tenellus]